MSVISNLRYYAQNIGSSLDNNGNKITYYNVYNTQNGQPTENLIGSLTVVTVLNQTSNNGFFTTVIQTQSYNMNITDNIGNNAYNFSWTTSTDLTLESNIGLPIFQNAPCALSTTDEPAVLLTYTASVANAFSSLIIVINVLA